jgi:hypothetical protein
MNKCATYLQIYSCLEIVYFYRVCQDCRIFQVDHFSYSLVFYQHEKLFIITNTRSVLHILMIAITV